MDLKTTPRLGNLFFSTLVISRWASIYATVNGHLILPAFEWRLAQQSCPEQNAVLLISVHGLEKDTQMHHLTITCVFFFCVLPCIILRSQSRPCQLPGTFPRRSGGYWHRRASRARLPNYLSESMDHGTKNEIQIYRLYATWVILVLSRRSWYIVAPNTPKSSAPIYSRPSGDDWHSRTTRPRLPCSMIHVYPWTWNCAVYI